ncbi:MAG: acyl-CoA thioesterase [Muribaculaceae bacterium]|nr:acyl-CoA thioesterase [Muribaculaceae bacterium]MDE6755285.1 acyl-CoA thioesterase [Muribaculaceae bacterium]
MNPNELPSIDIFRHSTPVQLRFNDVDVLGHVNNTIYFTFYDTAKAQYFTDVKGQQVDWKNVDTVIANVNCAYIAPIFFGEQIEVLTTCLSVSEKSFKLLQMIRETKTGVIKSVCETVMVSFDAATQTAKPVPEDWLGLLEKFENKSLKKIK